jgi:hypothetical protein
MVTVLPNARAAHESQGTALRLARLHIPVAASPRLPFEERVEDLGVVESRTPAPLDRNTGTPCPPLEAANGIVDVALEEAAVLGGLAFTEESSDASTSGDVTRLAAAALRVELALVELRSARAALRRLVDAHAAASANNSV